MMGERIFSTHLDLPLFPQLPEQCRLMHIQPPKKKNKHKHKQSRTQDPVPPGKEHLLCSYDGDTGSGMAWPFQLCLLWTTIFPKKKLI